MTPSHAQAAVMLSWAQYGEKLEENLEEMSARLKRGAYRAKPVRRVFIPKGDGRQRPLGLTALEDKLVQKAMVEVLNAVYETDFLGFSYGFRPGRRLHGALDALYAGIMTKKVSWVLDADIRGYFDTIDHEWLGKFVEHRIADKRVIRHIRKWLNAGVLENGARMPSEEGTPQGSSISPLLANIYLHYVFDLWVNQWRRKFARGDIIIVRFCDDFVVGFQYENEANKFLHDLKERFGEFNLELNEDKTRLIEFGRFADQIRKRKGKGKPDTFDFLVFTYVCSKTKKGKFIVKRLTRRKKLKAKLAELKEELRVRLHASVPEVGEWLRVVLLGHYRYFGLAGDSRRPSAFRYHSSVLWYRSLKRRSQRCRLTWERMDWLIAKWLPKARIYYRYPDLSLYVRTQGRSPVS